MSYMSARRTDWNPRSPRLFRTHALRPQRIIQVILLAAFCMVIAMTARPAGMPKVKTDMTPALTLQLDQSCSPFGALVLCVDAPPA